MHRKFNLSAFTSHFIATVILAIIMNHLLFISTIIFLTSCRQSNNNDDSERAEKQTETSPKFEVSQTEQETRNKVIIEKTDSPNFYFSSVEHQADSLLVFYENATDSSLANRIKWDQKFFCAFPSSFKGMQSLFGYDNEIGAAPLYDYPKGENVIQYFSQLESIPDSAYYDKYIRINIDGIWEADNIREAFDFANRLTTDTENACKVLSTFSDKEIKSVFHFIFDGPHPKNKYNEKLYENLKLAIAGQNQRLSRLLTDTYGKLVAEDNGHGH